MEFVEYYRIIRRRIWIAVVLAALAAAIVVVARLLPQEIDYPASGRVLVHEAAQRDIALTENQVLVGTPENPERFWRDLDQFVGSRFMLQAASEEMGIAPQEAGEQLRAARAEQI
ncbi:MAG: hypothetical protein ACOCZ7_03100, partial [Armatimonadota bacterium]